jgi:peptide-methionine (S)-S-oxide reductase
VQTFVVAGGCFWCLDAVYRTLKGVSDVVSGYTGGHTQNPMYNEVTTGRSGHAEAVKVVFDEAVIPAAVILDVFFTLHDPRQLNRQGNDIGTHYRSAMFYADGAQKELFENARDRAATIWDGQIVTQIVPLEQWWDAEPYHQDFFANNPGQGYCMAVALPKVAKVRRSYTDYVRAS